jgi:hypothetical protein
MNTAVGHSGQLPRQLSGRTHRQYGSQPYHDLVVQPKETAMSRYLAVAVLNLVGLAMLPAQAQEARDRSVKPAWPDVFVSLGMYDVVYQKPVIGKGDKPDAYQQKATYIWTGGRFEVLHITLARDPSFKDRYSAEALKKEKDPPKELEINKKKAWQWTFKREPNDFKQVTNRLVVLLDDDKAIIIEQIGFGFALPDAAKLFDFAKVEKALAKPPAK